MHDAYIIRGGKPLSGLVELAGAKNASIKLMIASVLFDSPATLQRVPQNKDNIELSHLLAEIGVSVSFEGTSATIRSTDINNHQISMLHGSKVRSSFLLFGPLLRRFGKAHIPNPGGCRIGARPIERIIDGIRALGVHVIYNHETGYYEATLTKPVEGSYTFSKPTHTGTEALILLAVCGSKEVTLHNCALEPEIDDLITFLNSAGARITRQDKSIHVVGVEKLNQSKPHTVIVDRNEAVTYATMAYATYGDITITNISTKLITSFLEKIAQAGGGVEISQDMGIRFYSKGRLQETDVQTSPHPGYMTDWQPQWGLLMATAQGTSIIHETMLESRLNYVQELKKVGANMELFQPDVQDPNALYQFNVDPTKTYTQAVRIHGVSSLHNGVMTVHDLRAGAVVVMAALSAEGESVVHGASQVERGYEHLLQKITALGGSIRKD